MTETMKTWRTMSEWQKRVLTVIKINDPKGITFQDLKSLLKTDGQSLGSALAHLSKMGLIWHPWGGKNKLWKLGTNPSSSTEPE